MATDSPLARPHGLRRLTGHDLDDDRAATPLELLFDLTLVVAFGVAGSELAHAIAAGHFGTGLAAFAFAMFGAIWAWMGHTWFASAYDTDDWGIRIAVLVQMVGVLILALGIPRVFEGFEDGWQLQNQIVVGGYIVMRVPLIALWLRVARDDPTRGRGARRRAGLIALAQVGWVLATVFNLQGPAAWISFVALLAFEFSIPLNTERWVGGTPWNAHHFAERYGLLAIIALGEGIIGTFAAVESLVHEQGWSIDSIVILFAGVTLTFGLWWAYFALPFRDILLLDRSRMFAFAFGHLPLYMSIAAVGAGLHVAAYFASGESKIGPFGTVMSVVIPVLAFMAVMFAVYPLLLPGRHGVDPLHMFMWSIIAVVAGIAVALAGAGASLSLSLLVVTLMPWVVVIVYEVVGHRHVAIDLERVRVAAAERLPSP